MFPLAPQGFMGWAEFVGQWGVENDIISIEKKYFGSIGLRYMFSISVQCKGDRF